MKTTNVENNPGPASIVIVNGDKDLQVIASTIIAEKNIMDNPLQITDAQTYQCEFDDKENIAQRKFSNGKVQQADFAILQEARNTRRKQGRKIEVVPPMPKQGKLPEGATINQYGEIERKSEEMEI